MEVVLCCSTFRDSRTTHRGKTSTFLCFVSFEERVNTTSPNKKVRNIELLHITKIEGNKLISFFDSCWFNLSFVNKNWQQLRVEQIDIILCTVKTKNWQRVTIALKVFVQINQLVFLHLEQPSRQLLLFRSVLEILVVVKINDSFSLAVSMVELFQNTREFILDCGYYFNKP